NALILSGAGFASALQYAGEGAAVVASAATAVELRELSINRDASKAATAAPVSAISLTGSAFWFHIRRCGFEVTVPPRPNGAPQGDGAVLVLGGLVSDLHFEENVI